MMLSSLKPEKNRNFFLHRIICRFAIKKPPQLEESLPDGGFTEKSSLMNKVRPSIFFTALCQEKFEQNAAFSRGLLTGPVAAIILSKI